MLELDLARANLLGKLARSSRGGEESKRPHPCQAYVSSNACARFRYLLGAATSAIRAVRRCCAIGFWKSRLLHKMPSSRQSCFAFSMISETVGSGTVGSKVSARTVPDNSQCWHEQSGRRFATLYRSVRQPCPRSPAA